MLLFSLSKVDGKLAYDARSRAFNTLTVFIFERFGIATISFTSQNFVQWPLEFRIGEDSFRQK